MLEQAHLACPAVSTQYVTTYVGGVGWISRLFLSKLETWLMSKRSYRIPGAFAPRLSKKRNAFLRLLKNKDFKEESMPKVGLYAIGISTTLESNKSLVVL